MTQREGWLTCSLAEGENEDKSQTRAVNNISSGSNDYIYYTVVKPQFTPP